MQWAEHLSAFDFDVQYVWGLDNVVADALLWLPLLSSGYALPEISRDITLKHIAGDGLTLAELQTATANDDTLKLVLSYVRAQWPPKQQISADLLAYYHTRNELHVEQDCLVRDCQFVPPVSLRPRILGFTHSRHPGITWMRRKVHETFWWVGLNTQVQELVGQCIGCQFSGKSTPSTDIPKISIPNQRRPG